MWFAACPIHFAPYLARTALVSLCTRPLNSLLSSTSFSSCKARNPPPPRAACCWPSLPPGQQRAPPPPPTPITPRTTCDLCTPHIQVPILHPIPTRTPPPLHPTSLTRHFAPFTTHTASAFLLTAHPSHPLPSPHASPIAAPPAARPLQPRVVSHGLPGWRTVGRPARHPSLSPPAPAAPPPPSCARVRLLTARPAHSTSTQLLLRGRLAPGLIATTQHTQNLSAKQLRNSLERASAGRQQGRGWDGWGGGLQPCM